MDRNESPKFHWSNDELRCIPFWGSRGRPSPDRGLPECGRSGVGVPGDT